MVEIISVVGAKTESDNPNTQTQVVWVFGVCGKP
jgi:hypothetical protein